MLGKCSSDADWDQMGQRDPYFAVCTDERYRTGRLDPSARAHFFRTGEDYVALLFSTIRATLCPDFQPVRALDFGCGVGRLAIPLARECSEVVGVDVSAGMLAEGARTVMSCRLRTLSSSAPMTASARCTARLISFIRSSCCNTFQRGAACALPTPWWTCCPMEESAPCITPTPAAASGVRKAVHWLRKNVPGAERPGQRRPGTRFQRRHDSDERV